MCRLDSGSCRNHPAPTLAMSKGWVTSTDIPQTGGIVSGDKDAGFNESSLSTASSPVLLRRPGAAVPSRFGLKLRVSGGAVEGLRRSWVLPPAAAGSGLT